MKIVKNSYFQSKARVLESTVRYIELHLSLGTWEEEAKIKHPWAEQSIVPKPAAGLEPNTWEWGKPPGKWHTPEQSANFSVNSG